MKLKTLNEENLSEIISKYNSNSSYKYTPGNRTSGKLIPSVENNPIKLSKFILDEFIKSGDNYKTNFYDYTLEEANLIVSFCSDKKSYQNILKVITNNINDIFEQREVNKKILLENSGFDSDVTSLHPMNFFEKKYGSSKAYTEFKKDYKKEFFYQTNFNSDDRKIIEEFFYYGICYKYFLDNKLTTSDFTITSKEIKKSEFENKNSGYVGKLSGNLKTYDLYTISIFDGYGVNLKFQKEISDSINTNGFW